MCGVVITVTGTDLHHCLPHHHIDSLAVTMFWHITVVGADIHVAVSLVLVLSLVARRHPHHIDPPFLFVSITMPYHHLLRPSSPIVTAVSQMELEIDARQ